jgi:hypothetical protein
MALIKQIQIDSLDQISVFHSNDKNDIQFARKKAGKWFDDRIINFLDDLSKNAMRNPLIRNRADIVAVAFWIRKSNLIKIQSELGVGSIQNEVVRESNVVDQVSKYKEHASNNVEHERRFHSTSNSSIQPYTLGPLGTIFHICPANVDTIFLYSLTISMLCGNKNILKISSRMQDEGLLELFRLMSELLEEHELDSGVVDFIQYKNEEEITRYISQKVDGRVIWGGNSTIEKIRSILAAPRCRDISFADRVSLSVFSVDELMDLSSDGWMDLLKKFDNDAYLFDQLGCSSPQLIYFLGDNLPKNASAVQLFREKLSAFLVSKNELDAASLSSLKLNKIMDDIAEEERKLNIKSVEFGSLVTFIELDTLPSIELISTCGGGYFYVRSISRAMELEEIQEKKVQTITHWGLNDSQKNDVESLKHGVGIDRVVPLGEGLNFDYVWDGYNLFWELSKITRG